VEFRLFKVPWESGGGLSSILRLKNEIILQNSPLQLIDPKSKTIKVLAAIFEPIEHSNFVNIFLDTASDSLEIHLCRHNLLFILKVNSSVIRSQNYHGITIDLN
jgi:hypothetical protein